jgi:hypothetical protein
MPNANDWNERIIAEFRENAGRVGGNFEGAPVVLAHHQGRKSRREYVSERDRIYDEQARRYPGFAEYAQRTAGIRTIPVLELNSDK